MFAAMTHRAAAALALQADLVASRLLPRHAAIVGEFLRRSQRQQVAMPLEDLRNRGFFGSQHQTTVGCGAAERDAAQQHAKRDREDEPREHRDQPREDGWSEEPRRDCTDESSGGLSPMRRDCSSQRLPPFAACLSVARRLPHLSPNFTSRQLDTSQNTLKPDTQ